MLTETKIRQILDHLPPAFRVGGGVDHAGARHHLRGRAQERIQGLFVPGQPGIAHRVGIRIAGDTAGAPADQPVQVRAEAVHAAGADRVAAGADRERALQIPLMRLLRRLRRARTRGQQQAGQQRQRRSERPGHGAGRADHMPE